MKKKKILDGTRLDSQNESATKKVTAPGGAAPECVELDDDALASVTGGRVFKGASTDGGGYCVLIFCAGKIFGLVFESQDSAYTAVTALNRLQGQDLTAAQILDALDSAGAPAPAWSSDMLRLAW